MACKNNNERSEENKTIDAEMHRKMELIAGCVAYFIIFVVILLISTITRFLN